MIKFDFRFNASAFNKVIQQQVQPKLFSFLDKVAETMRFLMRLPKSGRFYGRHRASAPGQAPAILSGKLIGSIGEPVVRGLTGTLRVTAPYAGFLERGTPLIAPRPFAETSARGVLFEINGGSTFGNLI